MSDRSADINDLLTSALQGAADVAHARLGKPVQLVAAEAPASAALLRFDVKFEGDGVLSWFVSNDDATGFSDMLIGGEGNRGATLTEMHLDALSGVFSDMLERAIDVLNAGLSSPLGAGGVDMGMENALPVVDAGSAQLIAALDIEGFGPLTIVEFANAPLAATLRKLATPGDDTAPPLQAAAAGEPGAYDNVVQLPNLTNTEAQKPQGDLRMLLNVPLRVTVELGHTERSVRDLLELNVGSVLELDKLAGDPMDIMVNGKVLARGEVVVIDEEFGVRITEILSPEQRLRNLG